MILLHLCGCFGFIIMCKSLCISVVILLHFLIFQYLFGLDEHLFVVVLDLFLVALCFSIGDLHFFVVLCLFVAILHHFLVVL